MWSLLRTNFFHTCSQLKIHSGKSLVLKKKPKRKSLNRLSLEAAVKKKFSKSKAKFVERKPSDYCEEIWLDNLNIQTLKLYRKTSFGSFRKVNLNNLIKKLKVIHPDYTEKSKQFQLNGNSENICSLCDNVPEKKNFNEENNLASPQMSDFLVKNMLNCPLLKTNCQNSFSLILEDERDEYGLVDSAKFPSVTRILNETMSESAKIRLEEWKKQMTLKLGIEGFQKYTQDPVSTFDINPPRKILIETHRKRKQILIDSLQQGSKLHRFLREYLEADKKETVLVDPEIQGCWNSLEDVLPDITDVKMVEECVHHPVLMYKGMVDCVASYQKHPCVIEWKKSEKLKTELSATYDAPLQLCAYLGALSWQKAFDPSTKGLIVVAYSSGTPANVFLMDLECCQFYWVQWLRRLQTYWLNRSSVLVREASEI